MFKGFIFDTPFSKLAPTRLKSHMYVKYVGKGRGKIYNFFPPLLMIFFLFFWIFDFSEERKQIISSVFLIALRFSCTTQSYSLYYFEKRGGQILFQPAEKGAKYLSLLFEKGGVKDILGF